MCLSVPRLGTGRRRLGVTTEQININSIRSSGTVPDSTVIDFSVMPSESGVPVAMSHVKEAFSGVLQLPTVGAATTGAVTGVSQPNPPPASPPPAPASPPPAAASAADNTRLGAFRIMLIVFTVRLLSL
jgi:hypothetical protein